MNSRRIFIKAAAALIATVVMAQSVSADGKLPEPVKTVLPNGLTVISKEEPGSGIVAVEAFIKVGAAEERDSVAGIGNLVARVLLASTRNLRAERLAQYVDEAGGNFETQWHPDYTELRIITTSGHFDDAMNLVGEILTNARFEEAEVAKIRKQVIDEFKGGDDNIFQAAYAEVRDQLYQFNPYKRPVGGYTSSIQSITVEKMEEFYRSYYVPNNIVISVAGDVTNDRVLERVKMAFAGTSAKQLPRDRTPADETMERSSFRAMQRSIGAAYVMMGFLAPGMKSQDFPAMVVAGAALGSGKGSRMFTNIREKQGIGYDLGTIYPPFKDQSHILAYLITDPYKMNFPGLSLQLALDEAKDALVAEVKKLQTEPLKEAELERAKRYAIGSYALKHQRLRERAYHLGWLEAIGLGYQYDREYADKIDAVTSADVQRVVKKYFTNYALVVVLPKDSPSGG